MIKLFFVTFFIAELIIVAAVILKIYKLDKVVNSLNDAVLKSQDKIKVAFFDFRFVLEEFNSGFCNLKKIIAQKQEEYLINILKNFIVWIGFLLLKGKYKKALIACNFLKDVYEGYKEA